nr:MAG TPA: hypothetical protein [Caudoviricetes sp.]
MGTPSQFCTSESIDFWAFLTKLLSCIMRRKDFSCLSTSPLICKCGIQISNDRFYYKLP